VIETADPSAIDPCDEVPSPELIEGVRQFNSREFYDCHETLEALWMRERRSVRELYQGIIQVGVGFYHLERGNYAGAVRTMRRGLDRLRPMPHRCQSVQVDSLVAQAEQALQRIVELGPNRLAQFDSSLIPVITLCSEAR